MDGGSVTAPNLAFYNTEAEWEVENHGVAPDIEVEFDPAAWRADATRSLRGPSRS
jgi:tricorn protease